MSKLIASLRRRVLRALGILLPSDVFMPVSDREAEDFAKGAAILRSAYLQEWRTFETLEAANEWRHPVADNPIKQLSDCTLCELVVIGEWDAKDETWSVEDLVWFSPYSQSITRWRPLPPPPQGE